MMIVNDPPNEQLLLLVEDDDIDAMMLQRIISKLRPEVQILRVANGQECIAQLESVVPRIIIMDIRMPLMDGKETLVHLKADTRFRRIPIVMMTTSDNPDDIEFCYKNHANAYMSKGIDNNTITSDVTNLLNFWFETVRVMPAVQ